MRLTTREVAERLGVKPATVYAYASRGMLTSHRSADGRTSTFDAAEVERLAIRGRRARDPDGTVAPAAGGAGPAGLVMTSALTYIDGERYFYRGLDALDLAASGRSLEDVAAWLWTGRFDHDGADWADWSCREPTRSAGTAAQGALPATALPLDRLRVAVAVASVGDSLRYDTSPAAVMGAGRGLMACLVESLPPVGDRDGDRASDEGDLARRLWPRLSPLAPTAPRLRLLRAALVLLADHELAVSTVTVRLAASTGAHVYAVLSAGLGTLDGPRHGGASLAAESVIAEVAGGKDAAQAIGERLRRGERIPGFGQPLYPGGDPRALALRDLLRETVGERAVRPVDELGAVMAARGLPAANVDLTLAALVHATQMISGAGEVIFAVARSAGWVAHALEEYAAPTYHRPRAVYTGPDPAEVPRP